MSLLMLNNVSKSFGERVLFENVSFNIENNTKMGFIGTNGVGKTTLFRTILDEEDYTGDIVKSSDLRIGVMEQTPPSSESLTAYDYTLEVFSRFFEIEKEMEVIRLTLEKGEGDTTRLINRQEALNTEYIRNDGLTFRNRTRSMLLGLGFLESELYLPMNALSGGQKTRLSLARTLLSEANFMLLDEPTNHLDIESVRFLEDFLRNCNKAFIVISHDRYFLDKVTNMTIELESRKVTCFTGSYSTYLEKKEQVRKAAERKYENTMAEIKRIEGIIEQQKRWNRERNIRTAEHKQKSIDRLEETLEKPEEDTSKIKFRFVPERKSGNDVLKVMGLSKSYGDKHLFHDVNFEIKRGERVFLLGPNGCGKSTLYKMIKGTVETPENSVLFGTNVDCAYYDQDRSDIQGGKDVESELWDVYPKMDRTQIRSALAAFLFRGEDVFKMTDTLSGGEKARISLLEIMLTGANFLLLDEPTNHLDIRSKEALEDAIANFEGTVFIISHDRYLINKMADKILAFENGTVNSYNMNYDDYVNKIEANRVLDTPKEEKTKKEPNDYQKQKKLQSDRRKLEGRIKRTEEAIEVCEAEIEKLNEEINSAGSDYEKITELSALLSQKEKEQENLMQEWENLNMELEEL
ncbi:MAG: ABC-F family ATP-binding cassette domain-containing protein [Ruminococcaceae bacterium]|nr:ABC-F family ATP-binding cassette domain-containing protein [Oscillospiraceae bacterium]